MFFSSCQVLLSHSQQVSQNGPLPSPAMLCALWWDCPQRERSSTSSLVTVLFFRKTPADHRSLILRRKQEIWSLPYMNPSWPRALSGFSPLNLSGCWGPCTAALFSLQAETNWPLCSSAELGESRSSALSFLTDELMILIRVQTACTHLSSFLGASGCIAGEMTWTLSECWHIHPAWEVPIWPTRLSQAQLYLEAKIPCSLVCK